MHLKFAIAIATVAIMPVVTHAQQKAPKTTVAEVQTVVASITADKAKADAYCEMTKLDDQIGEAEEKNDSKKVEELVKKADELAVKLGPEYAKVVAGLDEIDPDTAEGKSIAAAFGPLEKLCPGAPAAR